MSYRYDPGTWSYVAELLYRHAPQFYRNEDLPPGGGEERPPLRLLLETLAAPLAIARQSIEELHADLFIDTAGDWALPYLAEMVGLRLVFPDADSNRRDIRSTAALRRRKGSPGMLRDLGDGLTGHTVVTQEGWKLVQLTQSINRLRPERVIPDLRPAVTAEIGFGPLNALHRVVDIRSISATTGQFHPKQIVHWTHPTQLFPLRQGDPADLRDPATDPDFRWAFEPLGRFLPLRARRTGSADRRIVTDRTPPLHFDRSPGDWFGQTGRFSIEICGIPAGVAAAVEEGRIASRMLAGVEILAGAPALTALELDPREFRGPVRISLAAVALAGDTADTGNATAVEVRGGIEIGNAGVIGPTPGAGGTPLANSVAMIRLEALDPTARSFPGVVVAIESAAPAARLASADQELAREGFLRGALIVRLPPARIDGERWFYLAADGSVYEAQTAGSGAADVAVPVENGVRRAPAEALLETGIGPAWPPLPAASSPAPLVSLPNAPNRGPAILHGGQVLEPSGADFVAIGAGVPCALTFALAVGAFGPIAIHPFLRLAWSGPDPGAATWTALADDLSTPNLDARLGEIAELRDENPDQFRLFVRAEAQPGMRFAPSELAWTSFDGDSVLLYLPELVIENGTPEPDWPLDAAFGGASDAVAAGQDGSSWNRFSSDRLRQSLGAAAPIREAVDLRRRQVRYRNLCPWINEDPAAGEMLAETQPGRLDIDPANGLFSMAGAEPPQPLPQGPDGAPVPPSVTVSYQQGYTDRMGALPDAREPLLDQRLEEPTRLISGSGRLKTNAPRRYHGLPRYRGVAEALAAIAADASPAESEVLEFQDSATYRGGDVEWPANVARLVLQAAEGERPAVLPQSWTTPPGAVYDELILRGVFFGGEGLGPLTLPAAAAIRIELCTVSHVENELRFALEGDDIDRVRVFRSLTAGLRLVGPGKLQVLDSVVDAAGQQALVAEEGSISLDRVTVLGTIEALVLDASETIFQNTVTVEDRFSGCVRYSRVTGDSTLPRVHRVAVDTPLAFVSVERHQPAHARLAANADAAVLRGAEDGGEMGAFHGLRLAQRYEGYRRRLEESTPAGLTSGLIRLD